MPVYGETARRSGAGRLVTALMRPRFRRPFPPRATEAARRAAPRVSRRGSVEHGAQGARRARAWAEPRRYGELLAEIRPARRSSAGRDAPRGRRRAPRTPARRARRGAPARSRETARSTRRWRRDEGGHTRNSRTPRERSEDRRRRNDRRTEEPAATIPHPPSPT